MRTGKPVFLSLLAILTVVAVLLPSGDSPDKRVLQLRGLMDGMGQYHFQPRDINDDFSAKVFDQFLGSLDGSKRFLTQEDIERLSMHRQQIDDQINGRTFAFFDESVTLFTANVERSSKWYTEILSQPMDFTVDEELETDEEKLEWAKNDEALRDRWRKVLKYEVLFRIYDEMESEDSTAVAAEGKSFDEIEAKARKVVLERYEEWFERMKKVKPTEYFGEYLNSIAGIFDPHTQYFEPAEKANFDISMSGKLEGIGARLQTEKDATKVISIVPGGPAWKQKELEANDIILKVAQGSEEPVVVTGMNINDVVSLVRGKKGTEVRLTVRKADGSIKVIAIIRDEVLLEESFAKSVILSEPGRPERIGYILLPRFYADFESGDGRSCSVDMAREIEKLKNEGADGIIVDLRNNGGGSLRDVVTMTGYFVEQGPIVQVKSRSGRASLHEDRDPSVLWNGPLIVLVNEFSASASEIMAAALQDYGRAVIVGSPSTYGKGTVQRFIDLDNTIVGNNEYKPLGEVKLTIQNFYRVNGGSTQLRGVIPDIILPDNYNLIPIGEKEYDFALPFSEISPVAYNQQVYSVGRMLPELAALSKARVAKAPHFGLVSENAARFKRQRDETSYTLNLERYKAMVEARNKEGERFKDIYAGKPDMKVLNPAADMVYIQADSSRIARNEDFQKNLRKDMHLQETMDIMRDMMRLGKEYARAKK